MNKVLNHLLSIIIIGLVAVPATSAQKKDLPREDVIDAPAIGEGHCLSVRYN